MSNSVWSHRWQPTRLPRPWDSSGKNTGVGCHFLLQCVKVKVKVKLLSRVWLLATPWTTAYQAPPSMGFSRQEYWSGVPLSSPGTSSYMLLILCELISLLYSSFLVNSYFSNQKVIWWDLTPAVIHCTSKYVPFFSAGHNYEEAMWFIHPNQ